MKKNPWKIVSEVLMLVIVMFMIFSGWYVVKRASETPQEPDIRKTIEDIGTYDIDEDDLTIQINTKYNQQDYPYWYGTIPEDYLTVTEFQSEALNQSDESEKTIIIDHTNQIVYFPMKNGGGWIQVSAHAVS